MSQSYLKDIEQILGEKADEYLKELNFDPFENTKNQVKSMFSYLQDEDIIEILKKYNNNTEDAFEELMERNSQLEENKKRERKLEEEKRKLEIYNKYIDTFVKNFQMFDKKEIEEAFKNNNNDPQLTSKQLYLMIKEREQKNEEAKKLKKEIEIQNMQSGFSEKFAELSKEEIFEVIKQHDLNFEKIALDLGKMQKQRIFDELYPQFFISFSSEEIREALEKNNWVKNDTIIFFQKKLKEKEQQRELELKKQLELLREKEEELKKQMELQRQRELEIEREGEMQKQLEIEREIEIQKQKELEIQKQKEVEIQKQQEIEKLQEIQRQKELEIQKQIEVLKQKEIEFQQKMELQKQKELELEKQLEIQKQKELEYQREMLEKQKELEKQKQELLIPKLEYSEKQLETLIQESKSKMIDVQKILETEELKKEEETIKNIENMILEYSNPEEIPITQNVSQNECSIEVTTQDTKIVALVDFKNQNSYSWIGFYSKEDKDPNYKFYNYLCKLTENKFIVDKPLLNGTYQFRVFLSKYISVSTSEDIVIDRKDFVKMVRDEKNDKVTVVSWEMGSVDPVAVGAYVTIHKKEEERANYYRRWNWMKTFSGSHSFKTPIHTGEYEARVYFNGKIQFKSESFKIEGI